MAVDKESTLNLELSFSEVASFLKAYDGSIQGSSEDGVYWVALRPSNAVEEIFFARIQWQSYPHEPPSIKFVNKINTIESSSNAWPIIDGYRAPNDICKPFTKEGFETHPEWKNDFQQAWRSTGNPFKFVVMTMQEDLNRRYKGRHQG